MFLRFFEKKTQFVNSSSKIDFILRNNLFPFLEINVSGRIVNVSDNFCNIVKSQRCTLIGSLYEDYILKDTDRDVFSKMISGESVSNSNTGLFCFTSSDGNSFFFNYSNLNLFSKNDKNRSICLQLSLIDNDNFEDVLNKLEAISKSQAIIEFDIAGNVLTANENFCNLLGYDIKEITGKHHKIFVDGNYALIEEYKYFWSNHF